MPSNISPDDTYDGRQYKITDTQEKVHFVTAGSEAKAREWAAQNNIVVAKIELYNAGTSRLIKKG